MRSLVPALLVFVAACSSKSTGPTKVDLTGTWTYSAADLIVSGMTTTCVISPGNMVLTEAANDSIGGTFGPSLFICTTGGVTDTVATIPAAQPVLGSVTGDSVSFIIAGSYWQSDGTVSGGSMAGNIHLDAFGQGFDGTWSATKQ